ncbi:uncharacterized protein LOC132275144 [Cornus florida]|uniref:uncharacterized protein LOC132275144 n=1 Tax=Cornus florida TaxID=4283 RepID=UPI0028A00F4D|nr:uncharacterized protein LOC132275144 [Cornus florida]
MSSNFKYTSFANSTPSIFPLHPETTIANMVSLEIVQATSNPIEPTASPRISFSADFLDDKNFISISPDSRTKKDRETERERTRNADFEFLSSSLTSQTMITADELFFEGKLLPFWEIQHSEKLNNINLKTEHAENGVEEEEVKEGSKVSWFMDEDPSPRPPKCTVLWKELLRLKKQRASSLSPSSSSSSSSSSSRSSLANLAPIDEGKEGSGSIEKHLKRIKKGLERTRSAGIRIRPVVNVPICTQAKSSAPPPLFSLRKGRVER